MTEKTWRAILTESGEVFKMGRRWRRSRGFTQSFVVVNETMTAKIWRAISTEIREVFIMGRRWRRSRGFTQIFVVVNEMMTAKIWSAISTQRGEEGTSSQPSGDKKSGRNDSPSEHAPRHQIPKRLRRFTQGIGFAN